MPRNKPIDDTVPNPCRALMVINDAKIRKKSASRAIKTLKKLTKLEERLDSFNKIDCKLYDEWYKAAFDSELSDITRKEKELYKLRDFNYEMHAIARYRRIPLSGAYRWALEEQRLYDSGDEGMRVQIKRIRNERRVFLWDEEDKERARAREEERKREERREKRYNRRYNPDWRESEALEREWKARELLERWLTEFVGEKEEEDETANDNDESSSNEKEAGESIEETINLRPSFTAQDEETLKLYYRQLARLIHPDLRAIDSGGKMDAWQLNVWSRAQTSLRYKDLDGMKTCLRLVQLRMNQLTCFSISELKDVQRELQNEFRYLSLTNRKARFQPAWGFSGKTVSESLAYKLSLELKNRLDDLEFSLSLIRSGHKRLEEESHAKTKASPQG